MVKRSNPKTRKKNYKISPVPVEDNSEDALRLLPFVSPGDQEIFDQTEVSRYLFQRVYDGRSSMPDYREE